MHRTVALEDDRAMRRATYLSTTIGLAAGLALSGCSSSSSGGGVPPSPATSTPSVASSAAGELPTISEAFTLLPCPARANTTLQIEGCAEHRIVRLDRQVSVRARLAFASLPAGAARAHFVAAQLAWIAYRRAACLSESDVNAGGTLAPIDFADCEVRIDQARLADLAAMQGGLSP
jgi:uncharacterized protein YecT (DUF1311 family)